MESKNQKRVILVSVPKAGTYLVAQILKHMGLNDSHLHVRYDDQEIGVYDFRDVPVKMSISDQNRRFRAMPLKNSLALIQNGEFVLGHLPPIPEVKEQLYTDFKIIFLVRDLRDCLISHMRYMISIGAITADDHPWCTIADDREKFKQYLRNYAENVGVLVNMKLIACWEYDLHNPYPGMEIFKLRFEDLVNSNKAITGSVIKSLANFLDIELTQDIETLLKQILAAKTYTKSDGLTKRETYWSPFAEQWFNERIYDLQGNNENELIGYM